jgi:hypothetical protein
MCGINVVLRNLIITKIYVCIFLDTKYWFFLGTLTLIPHGHQVSTFLFHGMSNNFGSIDIIAIDELAHVVPIFLI